MRNGLQNVVLANSLAIAFAPLGLAQTLTPEQLDLPPETFDNSPVLQRWSEEGIPDVLHSIRHEPSFQTRWRLGYAQFPSNDHQGGISVGVEDIFVKPDFPLTLSAEGHTLFSGDRTQVAARANYYLLPLGNRFNIAPSLGYQSFSGPDYEREGLEVGAKLQLNLSRSGASNISLSQQFVNLATPEEMGITTLGAGYAFTSHWRAATEIQKHNSSAAKESKVGFFLEWMP
ncbi:hypothetical protein [Picosynechococcus sp. NKBG042902]|uniref:hypothetical protein n=1 Tax=Picosynechococcus sp. NKBG042902 TaxID=490193 RepID=UPI001CB79B4B|nr:hypothetical protein [Picosynechococcus sp. NKBG042902]